MFPRAPSACQNTQEHLDRKLPINLFTQGRLGVKLDASSGKFGGADYTGDLPFDASCRGMMMIWIQVGSPSYWVASNDSPLASSPKGTLPGQYGYAEKAGGLPCG